MIIDNVAYVRDSKSETGISKLEIGMSLAVKDEYKERGYTLLGKGTLITVVGVPSEGTKIITYRIQIGISQVGSIFDWDSSSNSSVQQANNLLSHLEVYHKDLEQGPSEKQVDKALARNERIERRKNAPKDIGFDTTKLQYASVVLFAESLGYFSVDDGGAFVNRKPNSSENRVTFNTMVSWHNNIGSEELDKVRLVERVNIQYSKRDRQLFVQHHNIHIMPKNMINFLTDILCDDVQAIK